MLSTLQNYYITTFYSIFYKNNKIYRTWSKRNKHETNIRRSKEFLYQRDGK